MSSPISGQPPSDNQLPPVTDQQSASVSTVQQAAIDPDKSTEELVNETNALIPSTIKEIGKLVKVNPKEGYTIASMYFLLCESLTLKQGGLMGIAKVMNANTETSKRLGDQQLKLSYVVLDPAKANMGSDQQREDYRTYVENLNTRITGIKDAISSLTQTNQQRGKGFMTQASSMTSSQSQDAEIITSIARLIGETVGVILKGR
jgi:hypothetical protein